jgi:hypothetical protein
MLRPSKGFGAMVCPFATMPRMTITSSASDEVELKWHDPFTPSESVVQVHCTDPIVDIRPRGHQNEF